MEDRFDAATPRELHLRQGTIRYRDSGAGEPLLFVHGLLVDGMLWRKVVAALDPELRWIVPDWPLGAHSVAMRADAELSPPAVAELVADFVAALELDGVTLIGNDTGGAISQLVAARHPGVVRRLVLTNCDAYDNFLPPAFRGLQVAARVPGLLGALLQSLRIPAVRRSPLGFGLLTKRPIEASVLERWSHPVLHEPGVRRDLVKFLRGISKRQTLAAAEALRSFDRPALIAWAPEDRFFRYRDAQRLADAIPDARLERIDDSRAFVPQDQPDRLAASIASFVRDTPAPGPQRDSAEGGSRVGGSAS